MAIMHKFELPFSMGKTKHINPITFITVIHHPILDIGLSRATILPSVKIWLDENCEGYKFIYSDKGYYLNFLTAEDIIAFKLVWQV